MRKIIALLVLLIGLLILTESCSTHRKPHCKSKSWRSGNNFNHRIN